MWREIVMKIQAINSAINKLGCQPIKQVEFSSIHNKECNNPKPDGDIFESQTPSDIELKYDMACRLAAYYKMQRDALIEGYSILA